MKNDLTVFDASEIFYDKIEPHLRAIDVIMKANRIPYFFTAAIQNGVREEKPGKKAGKKKNETVQETEQEIEQGTEQETKQETKQVPFTEYACEGNFCASNGIVLADDKMTDFLRVACGFRATRSENGYLMEMSDDAEIDESLSAFDAMLENEGAYIDAGQ